MKYLEGEEKVVAERWLDYALQEAKKSPCHESKRGVVIISENGNIIGTGFNRPPGDFECEPQFCQPICADYAVHAELVAMHDALIKGYSLKGATLYHARIKNNQIAPSGQPSCVDCSKQIYDWGLKAVILQHAEGIAMYEAREFHEKSLEFLIKKNMK